MRVVNAGKNSMAVAEAIGALGQTKKSEHQHITKTLGEAHHKAEEQAKDRGRDGAPDGRVAPKRAVWVPLPALVKEAPYRERHRRAQRQRRVRRR